jgi:Spy/CpxP family protein refolding chaperone
MLSAASRRPLSSRWVNVDWRRVVIPASSPRFGEQDSMARHFSWAIGVLVVLMAVPAYADCQQDKRPPSSGPQQSPRPKFWQDPKLRQEIGISDQQSVALEQIFSDNIQRLRDAHKELDTLETALSRTIQENTADVFTVSLQVDKVEAARSAYNKSRTLMLYRMNLLLSPEQRAKVKAMNDRYEEQRRKEEEARKKQGKTDER